MLEEKFLLFPVDPKTMVPDLDSIAVFPNMAEVLKAKAFLKGSKMLVITLPVLMVKSKDEYKELWQERAKAKVLKSLEKT
jgi:hypothetical protein